jgi:hypothetical protein
MVRMLRITKCLGPTNRCWSVFRARDAALHTLGNLTLITVPGNTTASNKAFSDKKPWLKESLLALNLSILERETWDEGAIAERAEALANLAIDVWPAPDPARTEDDDLRPRALH